MKRSGAFLALALGFVFLTHAHETGDFIFAITDNTVTITGYRGESANVIIPPQIHGMPVTAIGDGAFSRGFWSLQAGGWVQGGKRGDTRIASVTIPASVTRIGDFAFMGGDLRGVTLPASVIYVGRAAFAWNHLTSVALGPSVTSIAEDAFANNLLRSVTIPASVVFIGDGAFVGNLLRSVTIPASVTYIGEDAFAWNRMQSVRIPASVVSIGRGAFDTFVNVIRE